jgi:putative flippase GtrA
VKRFGRFGAVGVLGAAVQLAVLEALRRAGLHYLAATALAVEAALLHNFCWHLGWTWRDRAGGWPRRLVRFHISNGLVSVVVNLALMRLLAGALGVPAVAANLMAIGAASVANFLAADYFVFASDCRR